MPSKRLPYSGMLPAAFAKLTGITAVHIDAIRLSGEDPCPVHVQATAEVTWSDGGAAFEAEVGRPFNAKLDLDYEWDFGDAEAWSFDNPATGRPVDASSGQNGFMAAYLYNKPGNYTISCKAFARKPDGQYVESRRSTTLHMAEQQTIEFRCAEGPTFKPTGGTFRVSLDSGVTWTGHIAWNANAFVGDMDSGIGSGTASDPYYSIEKALEAVGGKGNFRIVGSPWVYKWPLKIEFQGSLSGKAQPLIRVDNQLVGPDRAAVSVSVRRSKAAGTATSLTVAPFGGEVMYWDPSAPDGGDGSLAKPHNIRSDTKPIAWIKAKPRDRRACIKRGTVWPDWSEDGVLDRTARNCQLLDYGAGARPIIHYTGDGSFWGMSPTVATGGATLDDVGYLVVRGFDLRTSPQQKFATVFNDFVSSKAADHIAVQARNFAVADMVIAGPLGQYVNEFAISQGCEGMLLFGVDCTSERVGKRVGIGIHGHVARWVAVVGCVLEEKGLGPAHSWIHHIYSETLNSGIFRWCKSRGTKTRWYFFNMDVRPRLDGCGYARDMLIADCDLSNAHAGIEWSNDQNIRLTDVKHAQYGKFHDAVVQNVVGTNPSSGIAHVTHGDGMVVRYCKLWQMGSGTITGGGESTGRVDIYGNDLYNNRPHQILMEIRCARGYCAENRVQCDVKLLQGAIVKGDAKSELPGWKFRRNQYWVPVKYLHVGGVAKCWQDEANGNTPWTFETWSRQPWVLGDIFADPAWRDPANGDFTTSTRQR